MNPGAKDATIRVRVPQGFKTRLQRLAMARNTDISELARQALFIKYPELIGADSEEGSRYSPPESTFSESISELTGVIRELIQLQQPKTAEAREALRNLAAARAKGRSKKQRRKSTRDEFT